MVAGMDERHVFDPGEIAAAEAAGKAAAQYCRIDPAFYIERSALAGVQFVLDGEEAFGACFLEADMVEASFLDAWLHGSDGAARDVTQLLRRRGLAAI
jgi:hypothetical protein